MKPLFPKLTMIVLFAFYCSSHYAQTLPNFDLIKLEKAPDYKPAMPFVLQTANYLLSVPFEKGNTDRPKALQFLGKWMSGTPDYSFTLEEVAGKITKGNNDLLGVYMAAMAKYSLENKEGSKDPKLVRLNALRLLLDYCENKSNNMIMTKPLRKLSEAKAKGELEQAVAAL